eukprot:Sdes_comp21346_c0_seq1m19988
MGKKTKRKIDTHEVGENLAKHQKISKMETQSKEEAEAVQVEENFVKIEKKKKKNKFKHHESETPTLHLEIQNYFQSANTKHIKYSQIQDMIRCLLEEKTFRRQHENRGKYADFRTKSSLNWLTVSGDISQLKIVFLLVNSLDISTYAKYSSSLPNLVHLFPQICPTLSPGTKFNVFSPVHSLLQVPKPKSSKEKQNCTASEAGKKKSPHQKHLSAQNFTLADVSHLLLSAKQSAENGYPFSEIWDQRMPRKLAAKNEPEKASSNTNPKHLLSKDASWAEKYQQYVCFSETFPTLDPHAPVQLFSVDCEMCVTQNGNELTRVSLLDASLTVIYDQLVKPAAPILDYNTQYSGITAAMMQPVTCCLASVQTALMGLLPHNSVLIGHSLENDLHALKMAHFACIDTALIYDHTRGFPYKPSLKWLAQKHLGISIQDASPAMEGHDSIQDAKTAMELVLMKLLHGPAFGTLQGSTESLCALLEGSAKSFRVLDRGNIAKVYCSENPAVQTDDECFSLCCESLKQNQPHFLFAHFHALQDYYSSLPDQAPESPESISKILQNIDQMVADIHQSIQNHPQNRAGTLFIVSTGHGNMRDANRFRLLKASLREGWTAAQEEQFAFAIHRAREALSFFKIVS